MNISRTYRYMLCRRVGHTTYRVSSRKVLDETTLLEARSLACAPWMDCRTVWILDRDEGRVARVVEVPPFPHEGTP